MTLEWGPVADALPNYEINGELGRGGWGVVLGARHRQLGREVAIKELPRAFASDPTVRARFVAEARLLASLDHPHIVPVYDYVERDGLCLLVMEKLSGGTVWSRFATEGFTAPAACAVVLAGCAGLHAAHQRGILHRDVKPANFLFSGTAALKVADFGIAKVVGGDETLMTRAGEVLGTPAYIAPEQAKGQPLSPATDVYAAATMLYELLAGSLPFDEAIDAMAVLFKHAFEPPVPLSDKAPTVPPVIADVVMRGLATDPAERFGTAEGFAVALAEACTESWGPGWLSAEPYPVIGAPSIVAATERNTARGAAHAGTAAATAVAVDGSAVRQRGTPPSAPTVRPTVAMHSRGASLSNIGRDDVLPVREVVDPPSGITGPLAAAAGALLVAVIVALIGVGSPPRGGTVPPGEVRVAGADVAGGSVVRLDLSKPVVVAVSTGQADRVRLSLQVLGRQVTRASAPVAAFAGGFVASINDTGARYLVAGRVTGEVELLSGAQLLQYRKFTVRTEQPGPVSAPGAAVLALILFTAAYAESFFRALRRGKRKAAGATGLAVVGALFGVAVVGAAWLLAGREPTVATVVVDAVLGAAAGVGLAIGGVRIGRRRRFRRTAPRGQAVG